MREIRSLRAMRRELETEPRTILNGHAGETPDTAKDAPTGHRASSRPYRELKPDLVFLDIQMPKLDGFEVLELIGRDIPTIFVTAYDEFTLRAFEVHAVDYLLKPFSEERLAKALTRARQRLGMRPASRFEDLIDAARKRRLSLERVLVCDGARVHVLAAAAIDYVEAQGDYICLRCHGREYLKQQTLNELQTLLDAARFVRIHRFYLLNVDRLARIELMAKDNRLAVLKDGSRLPVSRAGYARPKSLL